MNYKKISNKIKNIEKQLNIAIDNFSNDEIFTKKSQIYLQKDKDNLQKKWKKIALNFKYLKKIINTWKYNFLFNKDYNDFIIKYYCVAIYFNFVIEIQENFKHNEDFIRQYLDENFKENYSTIARFIYNYNFLKYLNYPKEFIFFIENKISKELHWMKHIEINHKIKLDFEYRNFYYYFKYRLDFIIKFFVKHIWVFLSKIDFKVSHKINFDLINEFYQISKPWDILLSRQNFVATNISIPWFWKHMSMYLWTWEYLKSNYKNSYFKTLEDKTHYIIESTKKWVCVEKFEVFIKHNDYLWVFRTNFSKEKIKKAILKTTNLLNKEYDYLFNFYSDNNFVCSELITKAYLKENEFDEWLNINLVKIASGITYPPNDFVKKSYLEQNNNLKEINAVFFIDKENNENFINLPNKLNESFKRSRFSFWLK